VKVYVNDREVPLWAGMTVRHALIHENLLPELARGGKVYDEWGNEIGLDGSLVENAQIYVRGGSSVLAERPRKRSGEGGHHDR
jgi:hypothetical protein